MLPRLGAMVRYTELSREYAALITHAEESEDGLAQLTVFGRQGQSYRTAKYSEKPKEGFWHSPPPIKK